MERDDVSLVKMKCQPGGMSLMPRNWAEVVKERRSTPQSIPAGRSSRSAAADEVGTVGRAMIRQSLKLGDNIFKSRRETQLRVSNWIR